MDFEKTFLGQKPFSFEEILDAIFGNITVTDEEGNQLYVNKGVCDVYGMTKEQLLGTNIMDLKDNGYINDSAILEVKRTGKETMRYIRTNSGDGLYSIASPINDENGNLKHILCLSHSERLYENFLSRIADERSRLNDAVLYFSKQDSDILYQTQSPAIKDLYSAAKQVAAFDSTVVITGETGVGKDVLARYIHHHSKRSDKLFIPVNCSAIPSELFEMEFFGYEKGSFTGALEKGKVGLFETATDGTLFLDEIGELPLSMQSKLLRVLEGGEFSRIGGKKNIKTNVRIISATNRNLRQLIRTGAFREDLFYRLNVVSLAVPSLKERKSDIVPLAKHFLNIYNRKYNTQMEFADDVLNFFEKYSWPGNIRELKNFVESMAVSSQEPVISLKKSIFNVDEMLANNDTESRIYHFEENNTDKNYQDISLDEDKKYSISSNEKTLILNALKKYNGNVLKTAIKLGISRQTLYHKIKKYDIDVQKLRQA